MSVDSEKRCLLLPRETRTSCVFHIAEEKDEIPGVGEDSVLEMLSYSKFSDLETWLCMPSTLLPRTLESAASSNSTCTDPAPCLSTGTSPAPVPAPNPTPCLSTGTSPAPAPCLSTGTSPAPAPCLSTGTSPAPAPCLSTGTSPAPAPCLSTGTSPAPASCLSTGTSPAPAPCLSTGTSPAPASCLSTGTFPAPASCLSTGTSPAPAPCPPTCSETGETDARQLQYRPPEKEAMFLTPALGRETPFPATTLGPVLSSTPCRPTALTSSGDSASQGGVSVRKRRRLAASPGGLHWNSTGSVLRDFDRPDSSPALNHTQSPAPDRGGVGFGSHAPRGAATAAGGGGGGGGGGVCYDRAALRKTVSVDDRLLEPPASEHQQRLSKLDRGKKKLRNIHSLGTTGRYETRTKPESKISRLAQRLNQRPGDALIKDFRPLLYSGAPRTSHSLDRSFPLSMTQQMQSLQLAQTRKCPGGPASPNAAKRLYRNLSEKLKGSSASSFEDAYFFGRSDRLRKASTVPGSECVFEAVEQQDLDSVQVLLYQYSAEELDLNTPNSQGLTPLDIAVMTNNTPIAKLLLKAGGKESPHFVSVESREAHLSRLVVEAERRAGELGSQIQRESLSLDACGKDKIIRAWEWRSRLYKRMRTGFQHARAPEAPTMVRLSVTSCSSLTVSFQEPQCLNSTVVTKYRVEWSCLKDFSLLAGEMVVDNLQSLRCTIGGLTTGRLYYVRVSAYNMKGWGPPQCSLPPCASPSNWRESDGRESRRRGHIESMERLLQQVRATHTHYCCGDPSKLQNPSRKQSVSRSLKHLFHSSNKFVKTLKRGVYLAAVFYHKDSLLVTSEDQLPIVEVDDSYSSSLMQDFLWFTKLSCMWEDVRWLRQSMSVSMSSSSTLQARHKMLAAAGQLQNLMGTHNLGRAHYEPIKDRHGNVLLLTIREVESQYSFYSGKWMQVTKLQSQRKSLSTPEEPYALDILIITIQDILSYQRRSQHRLAPGLYLGYLKLSSSVDQIRVLVPHKMPTMLCHARVRDNGNVSREEWDWLQGLSLSEEGEREGAEGGGGGGGGGGGAGAGAATDSPAPLLYYELQTALKTLLKHINLTPPQARQFRVYGQEVLELGHGVSFLLLLPAPDDVCTAPGQSNPYTPLSGFLHLPLQMFELVHFCVYQEKAVSLYCRLSSVLDLDALITQQALREAITDPEVSTAKQRHQHILDYVQQMDEMWRDLRWITDALQCARDRQPRASGVPLARLLDLSAPEPADAADATTAKTDSTSSTVDYLPTPSPSPEIRRRKTVSDTQLGSDEDGFSEVFLPTDSDYDSSDALSPRDPPDLYSPQQDLSQQAVYALGGSAPDVLQIHELRYSVCPPADPPCSPCLLSPPTPLYAGLGDTTRTLEGLSLSRDRPPAGAGASSAADPPQRALSNPPAKRKLLSRGHGAGGAQGGYFFSGPQRWLRGHGENLGGPLSEGLYTRQRDVLEPPSPQLQPPSPQPQPPSPQPGGGPESRRGRLREARPHVRRIFVEPCKEASPPGPGGRCWEDEEDEEGEEEEEGGERGREGAGGAGACPAAAAARSGDRWGRSHTEDVDSDDQTDAQVSEILSSTL